MILQTIDLDGFHQVLTEVCLDGETVTIWTEKPLVESHAEWIPGEGADICIYRAMDDNRVVGCRLALRREK